MLFQGLAVVLGKQRWPKLIASQRKQDFGLDAYAPSSEMPDQRGKGLTASITATLAKVIQDAKRAKENFADLSALLFVTPAKVSNLEQRQWKENIRQNHDLELLIIEREEIITLMIMPKNASLCASFLNLDISTEPEALDLVDRTKRAAEIVMRSWAEKTEGHPLIDLTAVRLDSNGRESDNLMSLEQINLALSQSRRIVLEGPAGCGKTTTLIQLAQTSRTSGIPFVVDLSAWTTSRQNILEFIAGMPAFQAERLTSADLAQVQQTEPFLFLLNGWNEIAVSSSVPADDALRELERGFPSAGIIVATRPHHLTPPLPGALRLRLLRLQYAQRKAYIDNRIGAKSDDLHALIVADSSLNELTRTPFILSEVTSLFDADAEIPTTKIGVLSQVTRHQEQRDEHRNSLQEAPIFGQQKDFLKALATMMNRRGLVSLSESDSRTVIAAVTEKLVERGQIEQAGSPNILAHLTAHHLLERVEYPDTAFRFEHQQFQEYYATLDVRARLFELREEDDDATLRFTADYVNNPAWDESLRMIAETLNEQTSDIGTGRGNIRAGKRLVEMALTVDLVFAGELAQLCGEAVWNEVCGKVGECFRAVYASPDENFRQYAVAAMLATGKDDFRDILLPLLSGQDQQTRLRTYRLCPIFHLSSLGSDWRELVRSWSEEARTDFVSELLDHCLDDEIVVVAVEDDSVTVKTAALTGLMWIESHDALTRVLESMDAQTFEDVALNYADDLPPALKPKVVAAMWKYIENSTDPSARLQTALKLIELGEQCADSIFKDAITALPGYGMHKLDPYHILPAVKYLHKTDPAWVSEWVAKQIAEGILNGQELWLPFVTVIPENFIDTYLHCLETEDLNHAHLEGMVSVVAAKANATLAARVFSKLRELRRRVDAKPGHRHEFEWQVIRQLKALFRSFPDEIIASGILSSVTTGDPLDITVAADLLSTVAKSNQEPLRVDDADLKSQLRAYLKDSIDLVLNQDDFNGGEKANLASSIAQVGKPEDMTDLERLIRADIERMRRGSAARAAGDRGPLSDGASMSYARWHVAAVMHLDETGGEQVLIDLLPESEYSSDAAAAMVHDFLPKRDSSFPRKFPYDLMWAAREDRIPLLENDERRTTIGMALNAEIERLQKQNKDGKSTAGIGKLASALALVDGCGFVAAVIDAIANPVQCQLDPHTCLESAERLSMAGIVLPTSTVFTLVDAVLDSTGSWMSNSDHYLLCRILALCPFVDDPPAGIAKMRDVIDSRRLRGHDLRELVTALGESRSDSAVDLLLKLVSDVQTFIHCEEELINAFATLDTPRARKLLQGFVDPNLRTTGLMRRTHHGDVLVKQLTYLAQRSSEAATRLQKLCEQDLPETNRHILSIVMSRIGTLETSFANLNLIDDARPSPVPQGVRDQLENAFIERQPHDQSSHVYTLHARASNQLRSRLLQMALDDKNRKLSAYKLLGQIEVWRLEHGRTTDEPRHPELASGQTWPPKQP